jgi:hypothetical protein
MTDGFSFNCSESSISPNCDIAISLSSPVFNEVQLGTRLHDSRSVSVWKEYGAAHRRLRCRSNGPDRRHLGLRPWRRARLIVVGVSADPIQLNAFVFGVRARSKGV